MKQYQKPEIEITEFIVSDNTTEESGGFDPFMNMSSDEVFVGENEGYIVN